MRTGIMIAFDFLRAPFIPLYLISIVAVDKDVVKNASSITASPRPSCHADSEHIHASMEAQRVSIKPSSRFRVFVASFVFTIVVTRQTEERGRAVEPESTVNVVVDVVVEIDVEVEVEIEKSKVESRAKSKSYHTDLRERPRKTAAAYAYCSSKNHRLIQSADTHPSGDNTVS
ncbi:hypothetical protein BDN70DRAFT_886909 [Pholiota conissans]|uniref:Uncharacterized protein n=1 Tax=Pholiota conissans TaxID=109636 RepID=A0A9P5YPX5_9AGAR|nr:hypothetical protein BDN70DRAFT_886909 [Pholiota conissans]